MPSTVPNRCAEVRTKLRSNLNVEVAMEVPALGKEDVDLMIDILAMRCALLYDLTTGSTVGTNVPDGFLRTVKGLKTLNVEQYAEDWKTLREVATSQAFLSGYPDTVACSLAFKQLTRGRIHYKWIATSALGLISGGDWFEKFNQWIVFDSKANFESLDLTNASCMEYLAFEERDYPTITAGSREVSVAKMVAREFIGDFDLHDFPFRGHHGNGATKEVRRSQADAWHKNRYFMVDSSIKRYLSWRLQTPDWRSALYTPYTGLDRCCVVVCVPKSMVKNRTISKEPTMLQYLQQDIFEAMDDWFTSHPNLQINLHAQSRSRDYAVRGSRNGSYATIDLSNASDSVSVALVELLFDQLPILYPLLATRSLRATVMSNDMTINKTIELKKFAPMGSATCFPVESLVFSIIVATAIRLQTGRKAAYNDYVVYGDDIVVKDQYYESVIKCLKHFGFTPNSTKSFGNDRSSIHFREACGVEAFMGKDVTPLRISRRLKTFNGKLSRHQAGIGVGQVDLLNRSYLYGFWNLRRLINDMLIEHEWFKGTLRLSESDYQDLVDAIARSKPIPTRVVSPFVICPDGTDTQWRCFRRGYFPGLQCLRYSVSLATTRVPRQYHDDNDLFTWYQISVTRQPPSSFELDGTRFVTIRSRDLKWSKHWVLKS